MWSRYLELSSTIVSGLFSKEWRDFWRMLLNSSASNFFFRKKIPLLSRVASFLSILNHFAKSILPVDYRISNGMCAICLLKVVDEDQRRREACLRQNSFFQLRVHLKRGKDLVAKDTGGESHSAKSFFVYFYYHTWAPICSSPRLH